MNITKRQWTLGALLAATLGAVAWVSGGDPATDAVAPAAPRSGGERRASASADSDSVMSAVQPQRLIRVLAERKVGDPFGSASFAPVVAPPKPAITVAAPPPPPAPPAAPPAPTAPPFPWTFIGRLIDDPQNPAMFLSRSDRLTVAHIGDTLENNWKVTGMDSRGLRVEYLPLKTHQSVALAAASEVTGSAGGPVGAAANSAAQAAAQAAIAAQNLQQLGGQDVPPPQADNRAAAAAAPSAAAPAPVSGIDVSSSFGTISTPH